MTDLLPMLPDGPWLVKLCEGWRIEYMGLLLPWGATQCVWLVRDA